MEHTQIIIDEKDMEELKQKPIYLEELHMNLREARKHFMLAPTQMKFGWNIQYEEKLDMLAIVIAFLEFDYKEMAFFWKENFRFYVDRKKNIYVPEYEVKNDDEFSNYPVRTGNIFTRKEFSENRDIRIYVTCCTNMQPADIFDCGHGYFRITSRIDDILKDVFLDIEKFFFKFYITESLEINRINDFSYFLDFLKVNETKKEDSKKQKRLDMISSLSIKTIKDFKEDVDYDKHNYHSRVGELERLSDDSGCVLRMFTIFPEDNVVCESQRLYIFKDSYIFATQNNFGEWVVKDIKDITRKKLYYPIAEIDHKIVAGTLISYTVDIINQVENEFRTVACMAVTTNTIFEQLFKAGYKELVNFFLSRCSSNSTPLNDLESLFGDISNEKATLYARFGLNKFQFEQTFSDYKKLKYEDTDYVFYYGFPLQIMRIITAKSETKTRKYADYLGRDKSVTYSSLSDMDDETFMKLLLFARDLHEKDKEYGIAPRVACAKLISEMYGIKTMLSLTDNMDMMSNGALSNYKDYLKMVKELDMIDRFKPYFNNSYDIENMHDEILPLYNELKEVKNREKFEERADSWKKWEYADKNYAVVAPTAPEEVADEGVALHHCVKTYISSVAEGETNILFIRKVSQIEKPFFTVEISHDGVLRQIHGFANRNLSSEPDLLYFVKDWVKIKDIKNLDHVS